MDGSTKTFEVDPAVTCAELCQLIKNELGLRDIFGFSIFIEALTQVRLIHNQFFDSVYNDWLSHCVSWNQPR